MWLLNHTYCEVCGSKIHGKSKTNSYFKICQGCEWEFLQDIETGNQKDESKTISKGLKALACTIIAVTLIFTVGCSSTPRPKMTEKLKRIMVSPDSISERDYAELVQALVQTEEWTVVDRGNGFKAIKTEQERLFASEPDRYAQNEKYSQWGKLYGVGAVIVAKTDCRKRPSVWKGEVYLECSQLLSLVDASTGEILVAVKNASEGESVSTLASGRLPLAPWDETVKKLNDLSKL